MTTTAPSNVTFPVGRFTVSTTDRPCLYEIRDAAGNVVAVVRYLMNVLTWCEGHNHDALCQEYYGTGHCNVCHGTTGYPAASCVACLGTGLCANCTDLTTK